MILSFGLSALKQSTCKFIETLQGYVKQESIFKLFFCKQGRIYCTAGNKRLVCCLCHSHHGDFVWAHDRVGVIVSLQICHSVCQQGSKTQLPPSLKIWLTSEKFLPATTVTNICNYKIRTRFRCSLSNGALLALHTCGS